MKSARANKSPQHLKVRKIPPPTAIDDNAQKESKVIKNEDDYLEDSKKKDHARGESLKSGVHKIALVGVIVIGSILIFGLLVWAWHILMPTDSHWLSDSQIGDIQQIMSSALIAIIVSDYANKYFR